MARIVLGLGVSHGPLLECAPTFWTTSFRERDRANTELWFRTRILSYDQLVAERASENLEQYMTLEETTWRHAACVSALARLKAAYDEVRPDLLVIVGNDHREVFTMVTPAFGIYAGDYHENGPIGVNKVYPGGFNAGEFYTPAEQLRHPGLPELGSHVITELGAADYDVASISETPRQGEGGPRVVPHAFGFIFHYLLKDRPPPSLLVHINTFYPPNQPRSKRVIAFSEALVDSIESWGSDKTVAIIGSGGLSHFVIDETLDRRLLQVVSGDLTEMCEIDEAYLQSGTSEVKNWLPMLVARDRSGAPLSMLEYVPCYRSPAGNGQGMAFAYWKPSLPTAQHP